MSAITSLTAEELRAVSERVASGRVPGEGAALVDVVREAEVLKCALESLQARASLALDRHQRERAAAAGVPAERRGRGVDAQVAFARRESPHRGRQLLSLAKVLHELPHTAAAFRAGRISEYRVSLLLRETACLSLEHRHYVDERLAADRAALEATGSRELASRARALAARLDPRSVAERRRRAEAERCVTLRPAPDTMAYLTALLPVADAVRAYAALAGQADGACAHGDERSRAQLMADTLVDRITTPSHAPTDARAAAIPVRLGLLMTDRALFEQADDTAYLPGHGPIPADLARQLLTQALHSQTRAGKAMVWLRRLYTHPTTGHLVQMDSRARLFDGAIADFLELRDQWCRHPWCDARIRHHDHITDHATTGRTSAEDGQGLCQQCNHAKQAPGWTARPIRGPDGAHQVATTTPTGHTYTSRAPRLVDEPPGRTQALPPVVDDKGSGRAESSRDARRLSRRWCGSAP